MAENDPTKDQAQDPANPDNRIGLERQSADREHEADIAAHPNTPKDATLGEMHEVVGEAVAGAGQPTTAQIRRAGAGKQARGRHGVIAREVPSTGHEWDGIKEYDNPLPRWWLWTFYATCVWAVFYTIAYPAWPLVSGATRGLLGTTTRAEVAADIERFNAMNGPVEEKLVAAALTDIAADPELANYTQNAGAAVFRTNCAQCHGSGAAGAKGYPNLLDNDWLWGGSIEDIHLTLQHGIRDPHDPDTRYSEMPKFGVDGLLEPAQIDQVAHYVLSLGGQDHDAAQAEAGATVYAENCVACHMEDGSGDRAQGAPALNNAVWLYGSDFASVRDIIHRGPFGVMPAWSGRLSEAEIRAVASYVHGLGGGE